VSILHIDTLYSIFNLFQLIELTQRTQPPPDLFTLQDGFLLRPDEIKEKFTEKRIHNRRWKKKLILPKALSEEEFKAKCREEASKILLQVRKLQSSKITLFV